MAFITMNQTFGFIFVFLFITILEVCSLKVTKITGPRAVQNGTLNKLVLDCEFEFTEREIPVRGLVVKWYHNRKPTPVYQWIQNVSPQASGILKDRVDLEHIASDESDYKHRALAIMNPTSELTGEYTCWVSTFSTEDFKRKEVIIYSSASTMSLTYRIKTYERVVLSCFVEGVYPKPNMTLFRERDGKRNEVETTHLNLRMNTENKSFNGSLEYEMPLDEIEETSTYECVVKIPSIDYEIKDQLYYYPGPETTTTTTTTTEIPTPHMTDIQTTLEATSIVEFEHDYNSSESSVIQENSSEELESVNESEIGYNSDSSPQAAEVGDSTYSHSSLSSSSKAICHLPICFLMALMILHIFNTNRQ